MLNNLKIYVFSGINCFNLCGDWFEFEDSKCFAVIEKIVTKDEAIEECFALDSSSTLLTIHGSDEQNFVNDLIAKYNGISTKAWIGLESRENAFEWTDGSVLDFQNFAEDETKENDKECVVMSLEEKSLGEWMYQTCWTSALVVCQKKQIDNLGLMKKAIAELMRTVQIQSRQLDEQEHVIQEQKINLTSLRNLVSGCKNNQVKFESKLKNLASNFNQTRNDFKEFKNSTMMHLDQVENAYKRTFEVDGSVNYYYPVAIATHTSDFGGNQVDFTRSPLMFDIYRHYYEKAPSLLNKHTQHYLGLSLKIMATGGGWDAGVNDFRVIMHNWVYNKGVAKIKVGDMQELRLFVWLRGGGVLYHINSPIDLTNRLTVYYEDDSVTQECWPQHCQLYPATKISPIPVGEEDPDLVKKGKYDGWVF